MLAGFESKYTLPIYVNVHLLAAVIPTSIANSFERIKIPISPCFMKSNNRHLRSGGYYARKLEANANLSNKMKITSKNNPKPGP